VPALAAQHQKEKSPSFLKKRSKRLLFLRLLQHPGPFLKHGGLDLGNGDDKKVFCFFSSEKKSLFSVFRSGVWH
jgi:hypothetical protein